MKFDTAMHTLVSSLALLTQTEEFTEFVINFDEVWNDKLTAAVTKQAFGIPAEDIETYAKELWQFYGSRHQTKVLQNTMHDAKKSPSRNSRHHSLSSCSGDDRWSRTIGNPYGTLTSSQK